MIAKTYNNKRYQLPALGVCSPGSAVTGATPRRLSTWPPLQDRTRPGAATAVAMLISSHLPAWQPSVAQVQRCGQADPVAAVTDLA